MPIIEPAIRPPSEADSFLLQVTLGCSANNCTFCGAYAGKSFRVKAGPEIERDIREEAEWAPETRRVFLMDGDALVLSDRRLIPILSRLNQSFPRLTRISSYANGDQIMRRSDAELHTLSDLKLSLIYMGLESGSQELLDRCRKRPTVVEMAEAVRRASGCGIKSSVMVLLGLGGKSDSELHVRETIVALNRMQPRYLAFLSLMLIPGTPLWAEARAGRFQPLSDMELLQEAHDIIGGLEMEKTVFRCNHASNYLPLEGRLPQDKQRLLDRVRLALRGRLPLRPEFLRGL
jgi:radical SAM superfamily enzyme YgiQ (UPF0313 family)